MKVGDKKLATKHEQIIRHISSLRVGSKISVRQIARDLHVSDGTAYRAIKEAENLGLVSTIERVGTIRIEQKEKGNFESLTFAEVINIVDGQVLGGKNGLHKSLNKFLIGAMELEAMSKYTEPDSLMIVGNRIEVHELALNEGVAVLITGGFDTEQRIKRLADQKNLPIMSTSYDTYTVAELINRAIYDQLIKKDIMLVSDVYTPLKDLHYLKSSDTVESFFEKNKNTNQTRFPVVNNQMRLCGFITSKDIIGKSETAKIQRVMTKKPFVVQARTSIAYVAHMMIWEGIEVVPVVNQRNELEGMISRQDVLRAMQQIQRQPHVGETIDDIVASNMEVLDDGITFRTKVIPQMTNQLGTLSNGVFTSIITEASRRLLLHMKKGDLVVESLTTYFINPIQIDSEIMIKPQLLEAGRIYAKMEVEIFHDNQLVGKGLLMAQLIEP